MKNLFAKNKNIFLVLVLISVTILILYWDFITGGKVFMYKGSDDTLSYVPFYSCVVNKLKAHDFSMMAFDYGIGTDLFSYQQVIFDPFAIIVYIIGLVFGVKAIPYSLIIANIFRILFAGTFCYKYLNNFNIDKKINIIVAYVYAFNGYIMLWGQHYFFATAVVLLPIMLNYIEKIINSEKIQLSYLVKLTAVIFIVAIFSVYFAYMFLLFAGIYSVIRILYLQDKIRVMMIKGIQLGLCVGFGLGLSGFIFLPSASAILVTGSRLKSDAGMVDKIMVFVKMSYSESYYRTIMGRLFSNNALGVNGYTSWLNVFEAPQLFFTVLCLLVIPQFIYFYVINNKKNTKRLVLVALSAVLVFIMLFLPFGSAIFNAFADCTGRQTFLVMPILAVVMGIALDNIINKKMYVSILQDLTAVFLLSIIYYYFYSIDADKYSKTIMICNVILIVLFVGVFRVWKNKVENTKVNRYIMYGVITVLLMVNICVENYPTINNREEIAQAYDNTLTQLNLEYYNGGTFDSIAYLNQNDGSFYRVEKTYMDLDTNDSLVQNYNGFSSYCSNDNRNYREFLDNVYPEVLIGQAGKHAPDYSYSRDLMNFLSGKYIITNSELCDSKLLYESSERYVYENSSYIPVISVFNTAISRTEFNNLSNVQKKIEILKNVVLEEQDFSNTTLDVNRDYSVSAIHDYMTLESVLGDTIEWAAIDPQVKAFFDSMGTVTDRMITVRTTNGEDYVEFPIDRYLSLTDDNDVTFSMDIASIQYGNYRIEWDDGTGYNNNNSETRIIAPNTICNIVKSFNVPVKSVRIYFDSQNFTFGNVEVNVTNDKAQLISSICDNSQLNSIVAKDDGNITANIDVNTNGVMFITIPYSTGWDIYIDGKKQNVMRTTIGFMGCYINEGNHEIRLEYSPVWSKEGKIMSVVFIVFFATSIFLFYFLVKKTRKTK